MKDLKCTFSIKRQISNDLVTTVSEENIKQANFTIWGWLYITMEKKEKASRIKLKQID